MKVNVILALTEQGFSVFKAMIADYTVFFRSKQGAFKGFRKTYAPRPDTTDEPSLRGFQKIETTVEEKLKWFEKSVVNYIDNKLSIEATNANGACAPLVIEGKTVATLSTLELMSLKSLLENKELMGMYSIIPVRSDSEIWDKTSEEVYADRDVYEQAIMEGKRKTTIKEQYILNDPNVGLLKDSSSYKPQLASKDTTVELGDWTTQMFSGEWTHTKRANLLARKNIMYLAVIEALKKANEVEAVASSLKASTIFDYLHNGNI